MDNIPNLNPENGEILDDRWRTKEGPAFVDVARVKNDVNLGSYASFLPSRTSHEPLYPSKLHT